MDLENCPSNLDEIRKEIQVMVLSNHPNVVSYYCSFVNNHSLWIAMQYLGGGSVQDIMKYAYPEGLEESVVCSIIRETLKGLEYFHSSGRIHRDLKAGNILIDEDGTVQIGDFGVSAWIAEGGQLKHGKTFVGSVCWMAPEVMEQNKDKGYDVKADIWSLGITALEIAQGYAPFAKYPPMKVLMMTLKGPPPSLDEPHKNKCSTAFKEVIAQCLQKDPQKRPSATKLLDNKYFKAAKKPSETVAPLVQKLPPLAERYKKIGIPIHKVDHSKTKDVEHISAVLQRQAQEMGGWTFDDEEITDKKQSGTMLDAPFITKERSNSSAERIGRFTVTTDTSPKVQKNLGPTQIENNTTTHSTTPAPVQQQQVNPALMLAVLQQQLQLLITHSQQQNKYLQTVLSRISPVDIHLGAPVTSGLGVDTINIVMDLERQVLALNRENEDLKQEQIKLKRQLEAAQSRSRSNSVIELSDGVIDEFNPRKKD